MKYVKVFSQLTLILLLITSLMTLPIKAITLKIETQPKTTYTAYGENAIIRIKASGDGLKYTWYFKNDGNSKYSKSSNTKTTYTVKMNDKTKNRKVYCVVKDQNGSKIKSNTVILKMKATIITQPKSIVVSSGEKAKITLKAVGDDLKYEWYYKNDGSTKYKKSSNDKATYSVTMNDALNGRLVYCIVTDKYGKSEKSQTVSMKQKAYDPLVIDMQPSSTEACIGDQVGFMIGISGGQAPYQYRLLYTSDTSMGWKQKDAEQYELGNNIELSFIVGEDIFEKVYSFCIEVKDARGKTVYSNPFEIIQIDDPFRIDAQPIDVIGRIGDQVTNMINVCGGVEPYSYQWQYCHKDMQWTNCSKEVMDGANSNTISFVIVEEHIEDLYQFRCIVTDATNEQVISDIVKVELQNY